MGGRVGGTTARSTTGRALPHEWFALGSLRTPWVLCGAAGVTLVGFPFLAAFGVNTLGGEYRHRTLTRTVLTAVLPTAAGVLFRRRDV